MKHKMTLKEIHAARRQEAILEVERMQLRDAFVASGLSVRVAAELLETTPNYFYYRLKRAGLTTTSLREEIERAASASVGNGTAGGSEVGV